MYLEPNTQLSQLVCDTFYIWTLSEDFPCAKWTIWAFRQHNEPNYDGACGVNRNPLKVGSNAFFMVIPRATKHNSGFITVFHNGFYKTTKFTNVYTMFKSKYEEFAFAITCAKVVWYLGWHLRQAVGVEGKKLAQPKSQKLSNNLWEGVFITSATTTVYYSNHLLSCKYIPMLWVLGAPITLEH